MTPLSLKTTALWALLLVAASTPAAAQRRGADDPLAGFADSLTKPPDAQALTLRGGVYVPAYSALRTGGGKAKLDFAVTLSIQNASEDKPLVLERIDYFDTAGKLVEKFLARPVAVRPYGTIEIFVAKDDVRGGTGANFVVAWAAAGPIAEPVIETVMISSQGNFSYSFVSQGRPIRLLGAK
jgi:hypothetical protein